MSITTEGSDEPTLSSKLLSAQTPVHGELLHQSQAETSLVLACALDIGGSKDVVYIQSRKKNHRSRGSITNRTRFRHSPIISRMWKIVIVSYPTSVARRGPLRLLLSILIKASAPSPVVLPSCRKRSEPSTFPGNGEVMPALAAVERLQLHGEPFYRLR